MSDLQHLSIFDWIRSLKVEGFLGQPTSMAEDASRIHVEAFIRAWADAHTLTDREQNRLKSVTDELITLMSCYHDNGGIVMYGEDTLDALISLHPPSYLKIQ